ncbi:MAG TPA: amidohydrolase family protein [Anditalea sp.]|nr:amidohydrolase family protein [Anditalea sp.]
MKITITLLFAFFTFHISAQEYTITNVHIISMNDSSILENHSIHIANGKIQAIGTSLKTSGQTINGKGAYLLPGLSEMHSHIPTTDTQDFSYLQDIMWLYLANGVLTIRGMIGHPSHLVLKQKIENGEITGPRIFAAGPSLNGNTVTSPESGREMVKDQKSKGYDHLKIHPGLDMERFIAIAEAAKKENIKIGGHVPLDVGLENTIKYGYHSNEHMDGYIEAMISDTSCLDQEKAGPFSMNLTSQIDMQKLPSLVKLTKDYNVFIAPTLSLFDRYFGYIPAEELSKADEMKYLPKSLIDQWKSQKMKLEGTGQLSEEIVKPYLLARQQILMALHRENVSILLSSDSPQVFNVPGFSIHHEIKSMENAGMSSYEILKSGTRNVAAYFNEEGNFGVISKDASADFILIEGNPFEDLDNLKNLQGIMLRGQWIPKNKVQQELDRIEQKLKND